MGGEQVLEQAPEQDLARQRKVEGLPAQRQEAEPELRRRRARARGAVGVLARNQRRRLALGARLGHRAAVVDREAAAGERRFEEVARACAGLAHRPAVVEGGQRLDAVDVQPAAQDHALFAQRQAHQCPLPATAEAPQQQAVLVHAVRDVAPVQGAHVGAAAGEQLQPGDGAGGAVGDQAFGAEGAGERGGGRRQQRVVAAGDQQAVGERAAVRLLEQPFLQQRARKQPLAADARSRNLAAVGELVELLLVQVQEGGGLARGQAGRGRLGHLILARRSLCAAGAKISHGSCVANPSPPRPARRGC